ncbi:hypothetical protein LOD99_9632 [Oopsacas minuta]|uniref:Uncharacterized protein n=1 Tax=Oopsacas minuta TaxID=111878 RepID=A0AAV7KMT0_9METZ|nr:hypothetical protein LOD99_9632 [Oopsacas minuta]
MLRLDCTSGSDSDGEFQPLLRLLERHPSHSSIEFIDNTESLSHHIVPIERLTPPSTPSDSPQDKTLLGLSTYHPCPCCQVNQSSFYCPDCINSCFYHPYTSSSSDGHDLSHRQETLALSLKRGQDLRKRIRPYLEEHTSRMLAYQDVIRLQARLRAQRRAVELESDRVRVGKNRLKQLMGRNTRREEQLGEASRASFVDYIQECEERCTTSRNKLERMSDQLTSTRRLCLQEIQSDCFLIQKLTNLSTIPGSHSAMQLESPVSPINKQDFVWIEPGGEKYSILDCCLPPASLYVPKLCSHSVVSSSLDVSRLICSESARTATLAALSHAAQLVQTIAFILDILLTDRLSFSTFNIPDTGADSSQLCSAASHLENDVVYLAATQGVPQDLLLKGHALENLLTLLNRRNPRLGQRLAFYPYPELFVRESQLLGTDLTSPVGGETRLRSLSNASDSDSDWEDLEKSINLSESCEGVAELTQSEREQQENSSRSRFLSFFFRSTTQSDK